MEPPQQKIMENDNLFCDMIYIYSVQVLPGFIVDDFTDEMVIK